MGAGRAGRRQHRDAQIIAGIDIAVVGQQVEGQRPRAHARGAIGNGNGCVVGAGDGHRHRRGAGRLVAVGDRIGNGVGGGFAFGQGLVGGDAAGVVNQRFRDVAFGGGDGDGGAVVGDRLCYLKGQNSVVAVDVVVVGQHVDDDRRAVFVCRGRIFQQVRRVVDAGDGDLEGSLAGRRMFVDGRIGDRIDQGFTLGQAINDDAAGGVGECPAGHVEPAEGNAGDIGGGGFDAGRIAGRAACGAGGRDGSHEGDAGDIGGQHDFARAFAGLGINDQP